MKKLTFDQFAKGLSAHIEFPWIHDPNDDKIENVEGHVTFYFDQPLEFYSDQEPIPHLDIDLESPQVKINADIFT